MLKTELYQVFWESYLILGVNNSYIPIVIGRQRWFTMLLKAAGKDTKSFVSALTAQNKLLDRLKKRMTSDKSTEIARHKKLGLATDIDVYFCDLSIPWQRSGNEKINGLLR